MPIDLHNISNANNEDGFTFNWDWFCAETTRNEKKYKQKTDFYPVIFTDTDISDDGSDFYASTIHTILQPYWMKQIININLLVIIIIMIEYSRNLLLVKIMKNIRLRIFIIRKKLEM